MSERPCSWFVRSFVRSFCYSLAVRHDCSNLMIYIAATAENRLCALLPLSVVGGCIGRSVDQWIDHTCCCIRQLIPFRNDELNRAEQNRTELHRAEPKRAACVSLAAGENHFTSRCAAGMFVDVWICYCACFQRARVSRAARRIGCKLIHTE